MRFTVRSVMRGTVIADLAAKRAWRIGSFTDVAEAVMHGRSVIAPISLRLC
jgi:hypothetical protein